MTQQKTLIFIVGPTAIGKSDVALQLAPLIDGEIISCDAMQVYREVNIASNKPSSEDRKKVKHHLIDVVSVEEEFHVQKFNELVKEAIGDILKRKKAPILVGGSGMYIQILMDGLFDKAGKNEEIRDFLNEIAEEKGLDFIYAQLKEKDPKAAGSIHPHDKKRVIRALEVCELTGAKFSSVKQKRHGLAEEFDILISGLNSDRSALYSRINRRVEAMLEDGLVEEVKSLKNKKLSLTAERIIGIAQIQKYLAGECDLAAAREEIMQRTRNYAKRQLTWFRKEKRICWIDIGKQSLSNVVLTIKESYDKKNN